MRSTRPILLFFSLLISMPLTGLAATFGELALPRENQPPARWAGNPAPPVLGSPNGVLQHPRVPVSYTGRYYEDYPPPWIPRDNLGDPRRNSLAWSYGQLSSVDNPYSWWYLDNRYVWARWGNPLAPWTSSEVSDWWRRRARIPYYDPLGW